MYFKLRALSVHLGPEERIESIVGQKNRRRLAIPYGVMVSLGVVTMLVWTKWH